MRDAFQRPNAGRLLNIQLLVGAGGDYDPTPGTMKVLLRGTGAGAGGGAAQNGGAGNAAFGGGGSSGTYLEKWIDPGAPITGGAWTGANGGGAGGVWGVNGGTGGTGADATIVIQGVIYTFKGGVGGLAMAVGVAAATTIHAWLTPNASGPADFIVAGHGGCGARYANGVGIAGAGGSNPLGGGGGVTAFPGAGGNAIGYGGGGSGAVAWNTGDKDGGAGSGALIIVEEYAG